MENNEPDLPTGNAVRDQITSPEVLKNLKDLLDPLNTEIIEANSFTDAHFQLGQKNSERINTALTDWVDELGTRETKKLIELSRQIKQHMLDKAATLQTSDPDISSAIQEYLDSLNAWSHGAQLDKSPLVNQLGATGLELALMLQNDSVGCQTIMIRGDDGQIIFGHSEEDDTPDRVRHNHWTRFNINHDGQTDSYTAYTSYSDLLPGPAFCLTPHGVMALDAIFVDTPDKVGFVGNTVSWILWRMGAEKNAPEIVSKLLPSPSGYAVNQAYTDENGKVVGKVVEFAGGEMSVNNVGENPGDHSLHTNAIDILNPVLKELEDLEKPDVRFFDRRINTLKTILDAI